MEPYWKWHNRFKRNRLIRESHQQKKHNKAKADSLLNEAKKIGNPYYGDRRQRNLKRKINKLVKSWSERTRIYQYFGLGEAK